MAVHTYRDLIAWRKAMDLVELVYQVTKLFPRDELYGLTSQVRKAVVSVPSNIAEGEGRGSSKVFHYFLSIANGSLREVETQITIAQRLGYISQDQVQPILVLSDEIARIIYGLVKKQS
ncbi:MAG: four helix bundle protein [Planctomycetota bacterium]|nr:four helix bundle protein [Planctomycetota bacterium]